MLLRLAHLGSSHHLHRFGDLRGVSNRFDPVPYVPRVRHYKLSVTTLQIRPDLIARSSCIHPKLLSIVIRCPSRVPSSRESTEAMNPSVFATSPEASVGTP